MSVKINAPSTSTSGPTAPRVVTLTDAATITVDADTTDIGVVVLEGNRTVAAPTGTPVDGQTLQFRFTQDGVGGRTVTMTSGAGGYAFSLTISGFTLNSAPNRTDIVTFQYNATLNRWLLMQLLQGFI